MTEPSEWDAYWESLTTAQRDEERRMMAVYVEESTADCLNSPTGSETR